MWVCVLPNVLCCVCDNYNIYAVVCAKHFSLGYLLVVCCALVVTCNGLMCLLLIWPGGVVAYKLCYMILAQLSGDARCTFWL